MKSIRNYSKIVTVTLVIAFAHAFPLSAQELFLLHFRGTRRAIGSSGRLTSSRFTDQSLITLCLGSNGTPNVNYGLVYNADSNSVQVVQLNNGSAVCDLFQFEGGATNIDTKTSERFTFVFSPTQSEAIGSAIIKERRRHNSDHANIQGTIQFAFASTGEITTTNAIVSNPTNSVVNTNTSTNTTIISGTNGLGGNPVITTNLPIAAPNPVITTNLPIVATNPVIVTSPSVSGTNLATVTAPGVVGNSVTATNVVSGNPGNLTTTNLLPLATKIISANSSGGADLSTSTSGSVDSGLNTVTTDQSSDNGLTANLLSGANFTNIQIFSGTFSGGQRLPVLRAGQ